LRFGGVVPFFQGEELLGQPLPVRVLLGNGLFHHLKRQGEWEGGEKNDVTASFRDSEEREE